MSLNAASFAPDDAPAIAERAETLNFRHVAVRLPCVANVGAGGIGPVFCRRKLALVRSNVAWRRLWLGEMSAQGWMRETILAVLRGWTTASHIG